MSASKIPEIISQDLTGTLLSTIIKQTQSNIKNINEIQNLETYKFSVKEYEIFKMLNSNFNTIKSLEKFKLSELDYINKPSNNFLIYPLERLYKIGFINHDYTVTLSGFLANNFSKFDIGLTKMLFSGFKYKANIPYLITIMAGGSISNLITVPRKGSKYFYKMFRYKKSNDNLYNYLFTDDLIEIIHLYDKFINFITSYFIENCSNSSYKNILPDIEKWCEINAVNYSRFMSFLDLREEIFDTCVKLGINPLSSKNNLMKNNLDKLIHKDVFAGLEEIKKIKKCIFDGFSDNLLFYNKDDKKYYLKKYNIPVTIKSMMFISKKKYPDNVPQSIISPFLKIKKTNEVFNFESQGISVVDCYIKIDEVMV
jgi:HrpA-like RNA helicase